LHWILFIPNSRRHFKGRVMDDSNQNLFNFLKISGPIFFFVIIFAVLYKIGNIDLVTSIVIAGVAAVLDYFLLVWIMNKVAK